MSLSEIATYMGYSVQQLHRSMELLQRHGLIALGGESASGGVIVQDPVLEAHLRLTSLESSITRAEPYHKQPKYSRPLTSTERSRLRRTGQLPDGVTPIVGVARNVASLHVADNRYISDIPGESRCNATNATSISNSSSTSSPCAGAVDDDTIRLISQFLPHDRAVVRQAVAVAQAAGHKPSAIQLTIDAARQRSIKNPAGLVAVMLQALAQEPPVQVPAPAASEEELLPGVEQVQQLTDAWIETTEAKRFIDFLNT
jgi:hypothetical protein